MKISSAISQISAEIKPSSDVKKAKPDTEQESNSSSAEVKAASQDQQGKGIALDKVA